MRGNTFLCTSCFYSSDGQLSQSAVTKAKAVPDFSSSHILALRIQPPAKHQGVGRKRPAGAIDRRRNNDGPFKSLRYFSGVILYCLCNSIRCLLESIVHRYKPKS
jgi:hypothetical protein